MSKYNVKMKDGNEEIDEEVEIDTEKQTETLSIPKTNSGNAGEVKVVVDFKKVKLKFTTGERRCDCAIRLLFNGIESVFLNERMGASKEVVANLTVYMFCGCLIH